MIRAISFDGDQTLWDFRKAMRGSLGHVLAALRQAVPGQGTAALTIDRMTEVRERTAASLSGLRLEDIRLEAFRRTLSLVGVEDDELACELNTIYVRHRFGDIELYPDVLPVLDELSPRFGLGLLSNGNTYPERCGLEGRFQFIVFAQDVGIEKPDPRIFDIALERAGCARDELLHVGDSLETDVGGARNAGVKAVWLNRDGRENSGGVVPDTEIISLAELATVVRERDGMAG